MKIKVLFVLTLAVGVISCGEKKENRDDDNGPVIKKGGDSVVTKKGTTDDMPTDLSELVYEGVGYATSRSEKIARSKSELKARVDLIERLANDLENLTGEFVNAHAELFPDDIDVNEFSLKVKSSLSGETREGGKIVKKTGGTLSGSRISEYQSSGDTTFAFVQIELMDAYTLMESAILTTAREDGYVAEDEQEDFAKKFKDFFVAEKKKLLSDEVPS